MPKPAQEKSVQEKSAQDKSSKDMSKDLSQGGYAVVVDGQVKTEFKTKEGAQNGARDLKRRFPMLQIKVYDVATRQEQEIELARG
ncbi:MULTISPECIES: hypothetical protein [unclassified Bradyrhizobium]|uniref:hypothetical protein n=2 Tax=unclassified Bradyrhizobium TaxID=2631580 RepID=UPI0028E3EA0F|nr:MULTISPECIES: hypothetical protein [unclassified Bradyrhizobium]